MLGRAMPQIITVGTFTHESLFIFGRCRAAARYQLVDHGAHRAGLGPGLLIFLDLFIRESMDLAAAAQCADHGQPWDLEGKNIPGTAQLLRVLDGKSQLITAPQSCPARFTF